MAATRCSTTISDLSSACLYTHFAHGAHAACVILGVDPDRGDSPGISAAFGIEHLMDCSDSRLKTGMPAFPQLWVSARSLRAQQRNGHCIARPNTGCAIPESRWHECAG